jgi:hypothetical protein
MFLSEEQVRARLSSEKNLANRFKQSQEISRTPERISPAIASEEPDRVTEEPDYQVTEKSILLSGKNRINLTKDERTEIAIRSRTGEDQINIARAHGITQAAVSYIERKKVQGIDEKRVEEITGVVRDRALERLMASLGLLTDDKLSGCSAKDLSLIASNMGRVVEKIAPPSVAENQINFIIYSPELKQERAFKTIEI